MTRSVAILGAAALPVAKWQKPRDAELQVLEHEILAKVVIEAVADAGVDRRRDFIASLCAAAALHPAEVFCDLHCELPAAAMRRLGAGSPRQRHDRRRLHSRLRRTTSGLGKSRVALALGVNFESAIPAVEHMMNSMRATGDVDFHAPFGFTPISWYAMDAARYIHEFNSSREELASVSVKNRRHASLNPIAQFRKPITLDEVLRKSRSSNRSGSTRCRHAATARPASCWSTRKSRRRPANLTSASAAKDFFHEGAHQINEVPNDMIALVSAQKAGQAAYQEAGIVGVGYRSCRALRALHYHRGARERGARSGAARAGRPSLRGGRDVARRANSDLYVGRPAVARPSGACHPVLQSCSRSTSSSPAAPANGRSPMPGLPSPAPSSATTMLRWSTCWRRVR